MKNKKILSLVFAFVFAFTFGFYSLEIVMADSECSGQAEGDCCVKLNGKNGVCYLGYKGWGCYCDCVNPPWETCNGPNGCQMDCLSSGGGS